MNGLPGENILGRDICQLRQNLPFQGFLPPSPNAAHSHEVKHSACLPCVASYAWGLCCNIGRTWLIPGVTCPKLGCGRGAPQQCSWTAWLCPNCTSDSVIWLHTPGLSALALLKTLAQDGGPFEVRPLCLLTCNLLEFIAQGWEAAQPAPTSLPGSW